MEYRSRGDIDNQIGHIYEYLKPKISNMEWYLTKDSSAVELIKYNNVFLLENVLNTEEAKKICLFIQKIKFDATKKVLNDTDNQPTDDVFKNVLPLVGRSINYKKNKIESKSENWEW